MAIKLELTGIHEQLVLKTLQLAPYSDFGYGDYAEFAMTPEELKAARANYPTESAARIKKAKESMAAEDIKQLNRAEKARLGEEYLPKSQRKALADARQKRIDKAERAAKRRTWDKASIKDKAAMVGEDVGTLLDDSGKWIKANPLKAGAAGVGAAGLGAAGIYALTRPRRRD